MIDVAISAIVTIEAKVILTSVPSHVFYGVDLVMVDPSSCLLGDSWRDND